MVQVKKGLVSLLVTVFFPAWAAITSGWIVRDMLNKPRPPVVFHSATLMDAEVYPGESLVITYKYDRKETCAAYVDQFILSSDDIPILQRSLPVGYTREGKGIEQKVTIPVPMSTPPGRYRTMSQRTDKCPRGETFQRYGEFEFVVLPTQG